MKENHLVLAQVIGSGDYDVARRDEPRGRASDEAALLMSASFQPRVEQREVRTAVVDLAIVLTYALTLAHDGGVLRQFVAHSGDVLREMHGRVRIVADAEE